MATCDYCGKEVVNPFNCNYCDGTFCSEHRLPPNHECPHIESWKGHSGPSVGSHEKKKSWIAKKKESLFENISLPFSSQKTEKETREYEKNPKNQRDSEFQKNWGKFEYKFLKLSKYLGGLLFVLGCLITWISFFGLEKIRNLLSEQIMELINYLIPSSILSPISTSMENFFSNPVSAWGDGAWISIFGFLLFFSGWIVTKVRSKHGRRYRDWTSFGIAKKIGCVYAFTIILWILSVMIMETYSANLILENGWPRAWFTGFLVVLGLMAFYMGRIRRGSWWSKRKAISIILVVILGVYSLHVYNTLSNPKIEFDSLELNSREVVAGDSLTSTIEVGRICETKDPILNYMREHPTIWDFLKSVFSQEENVGLTVAIKIDGETYSERKIELGIDEVKKVSYNFSENEVGEHTLTVREFSQDFTVLEPLNFDVISLDIEPENAKPGENVKVDTYVHNAGGRKGTQTLRLRVNDRIEKTENITLLPGENKEVLFSLQKEIGKRYTVRLGDLSRSFRVLKPANFLGNNLEIYPSEVQAGEDVSVRLNVKNVGEIKDTKKLELRIGDIEKSRNLTLEPNENMTVSFTLKTPEEEGNYTVSISGMSEPLHSSIEVNDFSKYKTGPKEIQLQGPMGSSPFDFVVYEGVNDYLASLPRSMTYQTTPPTTKDFILRDLNNDVQGAFLSVLLLL